MNLQYSYYHTLQDNDLCAIVEVTTDYNDCSGLFGMPREIERKMIAEDLPEHEMMDHMEFLTPGWMWKAVVVQRRIDERNELAYPCDDDDFL